MSGVNVRLLVVDDDPLLREILSEGLEQEGFEVVVAEDGAIALELFRNNGPFAAVLVDEEMPRVTGRQFLQQTHAERRGVAALLVSGNLTLDEAEQRELDVGPVMNKPFSFQELVGVIRAAIASKAPAIP
jgi:two-component system response regulator RegX3